MSDQFPDPHNADFVEDDAADGFRVKEPASQPASDIDTRKITVTFIRDKSGQEMRRVDMTLSQLAEHIRFRTATDKMELPWLKLALFGNKRSEKNSLRTDANTLMISGVEGDHDSGEISFEDAVERTRKAGIRALLYTSSSWVSGEREKWRILLPLSQNREPEVRAKFTARINGLFDGKLAGESFTLSQGYLYGHLEGRDHRVEVLDGEYLDRCDRTHAGSIFKDGSRIGGQAANGSGGIDLNKAGPQQRSRRDDDPEPVELGKIKAALDVIDSNCSYEVWLKVAGALHTELGEHGFPLFDAWSAKATAIYTEADAKERWRGARTMKDVTVATIFHYASNADPTWLDRYEDEERRRIYAELAGAGQSNGAGSGSGSGSHDYTEEFAKTDTDPASGGGNGGTVPPDNPGPQPGPNPQPGPSPGPKPQPGQLQATPYAWVEPERIPQRDWLYGRLLIRKFVTATIAPGGLGKSSLVTVESLAQVCDRDLLGVKPSGELRVWLINLEDPGEETTRKIQAVAKHYGLTKDDIGDRLFADSGRDQEFVIARMDPHGRPALVIPVLKAIVNEIIARKIDILVIDPFVSCHEVPENDNVAQDMVVKAWAAVAERGNCAVHLIDHTRKMGAESEVTTESSRGAKAKTDAARVVRVLNRMSEEQGTAAGVDNHRLYFRTYNDKANLAPPADKSDWHMLKSVTLGNGPVIEFLGKPIDGSGDAVGVVTRWEWPDPLAGMTGSHFEKVAAVIRQGKWRADIRATAWVGNAVAQALGLSVTVKKERARIRGMLKIWLDAGSIMVIERPDEHRDLRQFVEVADPEDAD